MHLSTLAVLAVLALTTGVSSQPVVCPGSDGSSCPSGNTCCYDGPIHPGYRCCPHPNAHCCSDYTHCCSQNTTCCRTFGGYSGCCPYHLGVCCNSQISGNPFCCPEGHTCYLKSNPGRCSSAAKKISMFATKSASNNAVCLGGQSECGGGCCPLSNAVCCSDYIHCCPEGSTCDISTKTCIRMAATIEKSAHKLSDKRVL